MTLSAQRAAIAKYCGYKYAGMGIWVHPRGFECFGTPEACLPNYPSSLDLMREAIMKMPVKLRIRFRQELQYLIAPATRPSKACGIKLMNEESYDKWFHATSLQQAEAFLKTLNLWDDDLTPKAPN